MVRWTADESLQDLLRRYYRGEALLWEEIRQRVDAELVQRGATGRAYHIRFRLRSDDGYDIIVEEADAYRVAD